MKKKLITGFTLVELLLYMAILSIMLLVLTNIFTSLINIQLESESTSAISQDGNYILSRLTYDIQRAEELVAPVSPGEPGNELTLKIDGSNHTYRLSNNNLQLSTALTADTVNSYGTNISNVTFTRLGTSQDDTTIRITLTLTSETIQPKGPESQTFITTLALRKK